MFYIRILSLYSLVTTASVCFLSNYGYPMDSGIGHCGDQRCLDVVLRNPVLQALEIE